MPHAKLNKFFMALILVSVLVTSGGCKKFLDPKPKISQVVPYTLDDLQYLFNNYDMNSLTNSAYFSVMVGDDYYVRDADWPSLDGIFPQYTQNYIWASSTPPTLDEFWNGPYKVVNIANTVLDRLPEIEVATQDTAFANTLRGTGLFYRAFAFWNLAQLYARPYATEYFPSPGIVLRLTSDAAIVPHTRATVKETYDQIVSDLKEAAGLLPVSVSLPTRPGQTAAYAELSRVYLSMRDYQNAGYYANLALGQKNGLYDYNLVANPPPAFRFPNYSNPEMIFDNTTYVSFPFLGFYELVDSSLYQSYSGNDLRKSLFFNPNNGYYRFYGAYNGLFKNTPYNIWDGLAVDELYLTRAECSARAGNKDSAMSDLNRLLRARWKTGTYTDITAVSAPDALAKVLVERRKELTHRGQRWTDVRRLNADGANITLKRVVLGTTYTLSPNDARSVMLIPKTEIDLSGIPQNVR